MVAKTSERELRYRERQRERGYKYIRVWVPVDRADEIKSIAQTMRDKHTQAG